MKLWDAARQQELATFRGHKDQVWGCAFYPDGKRAVSASWDTSLKVWDVASVTATKEISQESKRFESPRRQTGPVPKTNETCPPRVAEASLPGPLLCSAFSPDGRFIVAGTWDGWLRCWETGTGTERRELKLHDVYVTALAFLPDGKWILSGATNGQLKLLDTLTWMEGPTFELHRRAGLRVFFLS